ncbi:MAG: redox-regulated ATPase YchF [Calditrichia bacterium]
MEVGIIGLPYSGKTTLFSTLTGQNAVAAHTGGKIEVHRGVVKVPDSRLDNLTEIFNPKKQINATIEYIEVGGIEPEAGQGKGFDAQFLKTLKNTDALCHIVRAFKDEVFPHPSGSLNPARDVQTLETEFILSDFLIVENRIDRLEKQIQKIKSEQDIRELALMNRCREILENDQALRTIDFTEEEAKQMKGYQFLSAKPLIIVVNMQEEDIARESEILQPLEHYRNYPNVVLTGLSAKVELEISQLSEEDRSMFMEELQITEPALNKMIRQSYSLLGLISFFTVGDDECRAWTVSNGTTAQKAAGAIHSDLERGFIRAEVIHYDTFMELGSLAKAKEKGVLRLEGKDYPVRDGDIISVRFHV